MDLNDDLNVVEAREQILKEALEKIVRLGLGEGLGGGYKYKEEHHAKALSIAGTALTTLPKGGRTWISQNQFVTYVRKKKQCV